MKQYLNNAFSLNNKKLEIQVLIKIMLTKQNSSFKISAPEKRNYIFGQILMNKRFTITLINL